MKKPTLIFLLCLLAGMASAQSLTKSINRSLYTYVYRLSDASVKLFYTGGADKMDERIQGAPIDSFRTGNYKAWHLAPGNYVEVYAANNTMHYRLVEQHTAILKLIDDTRELRFVVLDTNNNQVKDAVISARHKPVPYDAKLGLYHIPRNKKDTLLNIYYQGVSNYYKVKPDDENRFRYPYRDDENEKKGWISRLWAALTKPFRKSKPLDRYAARPINPGYVVFNKPKYRPGDTVKMKAFLLDRESYKPVKDKRLLMRLTKGYGDEGVILGYVNAYRAGAFQYSFKLSDTLKLRLDQDYYVSLETADNPFDQDIDKVKYLAHCKVYIQSNFRYEDYELKTTKFTVRVDRTEHGPGQPASLYMRAVDDNGLDVADGRVNITIRTQSIGDFEGQHLFIRDTLWQHQVNLDPVGETKFIIPDSIFPKAYIRYSVQSVLLTSNNERREQTQYLTFTNKKDGLTHKLDADTLKLTYLLRGKSQNKPATLYRLSEGQDTLSRSKITLPAKIKIDPAIAIYGVETDSLNDEIRMDQFGTSLHLNSAHTADSLQISMDNQLHLPLWYTVYAGDKVLAKGTGTSLSYQQPVKGKTASVRVSYIWAGKMSTYETPVNFADKVLKISVKAPETVYPGEQAEIKIHVADAKGAPVAGADLTAYSLTAKFENYRAPLLPYLGKRYTPRDKGIPLQINMLKNDGAFKLNWQRWSKQMGLDSIEYYKFTHPDTVYRIEESTPDTTTQIAPFVVKDGEIIPVHILYIDGVPVYFSKTNDLQRYSFMVKPGVYNLHFRTKDQNIRLNNVRVEENKKLILSLNADALKNKLAEFKSMPDTLTDYEAQLLNKYMVSIEPDFGQHLAAITQRGRIFLLGATDAGNNSINLNRPNYYANNLPLLTGPVAYNNLLFSVKGQFDQLFMDEPGYSFQIASGLIKQKSLPTLYPFTRGLYNQAADLNYRQYAFTAKAVDTLYQNYLDLRNHNNDVFNNRYSYLPTNAPLTVTVGKLANGNVPFVKSIILYKYDDPDYMQIFAGSRTELGNLEPGNYRVMYLFKGNSYYLQENVSVRPHGKNLYNTGIITPHIKDSTSIKIAKLIDDHVQYSSTTQDVQQIKEVFNEQYLDQTTLKGEMSGYVYDQKDRMPIPGVVIRVRGMQGGVATNIDGYFKLKVPKSGHLVLSTIGYVADEVPIAPGKQVKFYLNPSTNELREVMITSKAVMDNGTGLSIDRRDQTTSTFALMAKDVETLQATTIDQAVQGRLPGIEIYKMDTVMYSAAAYKVWGNSNLNDLLKKMEGFEVGADGSITRQGQAVTKIRLNGKDYAGAQADVLLKNLPADVIENIQLVDDYGDQAARSGIKGGDPQNVLNLNTIKNIPFGKILLIKTNKAFALGLNDPALLAAQSIRKNFSDYAYWQPRLITDAQGNASFKTTFPDDITQWRTFVLGMTGNKQSGVAIGQIKSYKPLSANFTAPLFAISGDVLKPIGKVLNYTPDTVHLKRTFKINGEVAGEKDITVKTSVIDTFSVAAAGNDSLKFEYTVKKGNGYFDGEQRSIPVFEQGTLETKGKFASLGKDTTMTIQLDPKLKEGTFHAEASVLPALLDETEHLRNYEYLCNEQLASKLKGLLTEKKIKAYLDEPFKYDKDINDIIKKLQDNRRAQGTWGWWKDSDEEMWISLHAADALLEAEAAGFKTQLDKQKLIDYLLYQASAYKGEDKLTVLLLLKKLNAKADYAGHIDAYIKQIDPKDKPSHYDAMRLMLVQQQAGLPYQRDSLTAWMHQTIMGSVYWGNDSYSFFYNSIQESLLAYQLLKAEGKHPDLLEKLRNYFLGQRKDGYWRNTYESAQILETILPDLLINGKKPEPSVIVLSGARNETVTQFPYTTSLTSTDALTVKKTGTMPVYITAYQKFWNPQPEKVSKDFTVDTRFEKNNQAVTKAKGGDAITLEVEVNARADADFVMVEIPIPAGCSYQDKNQAYANNEVHREYFKNKVSIFCRKLTAGKHSFTVTLTARYGGTYHVNPAKAEMMYFPVFYGREGMKMFAIE